MGSANLRAASIVLFLLAGCGGGSSLGPLVRVTEYGLYARGVEVVRPDPNVPSGQSRGSVGVKLEQQTQFVPLALGISFGFCFEISQVPAGLSPHVEVAVQHPEIVRSDGARSTSFRTQPSLYSLADRLRTCVGYGFDHQFELVPGTWRFTVVVDGLPSIVQEFRAQ